MPRTLLLVASLATLTLLAPTAQAVLVIPPLEDIPRIVFEGEHGTWVVEPPCAGPVECLPPYCVPPGAPCNPFGILGDLVGELGDILP